MTYIEKNEEILSGNLVIKGTRIPAERLYNLIKLGYTEENIKEEFPGVPAKTIRGALTELIKAGLQKAGV